MILFGLVSLRQHPSGAFIKSEGSVAGLEKILSWFETISISRFCLELAWFAVVWIGMVWFDLRQHPSEASVKVSSRSDLFLLFVISLLTLYVCGVK